MKKQIIISKKAPVAIGPYSQAVKANGFVYTSAQLPLNPVSGAIEGDNIKAQTIRVFENLRNILEDSGTGMENVVKTTVYIMDMEYFSDINIVYSRFFPVDQPARSCIQVSNLPKSVLIMIEAVATCN